MLRGDGERAPRPHSENLAGACERHAGAGARGTPDRNADRQGLRLCRRAGRRDVLRAQGRAPGAAGERNRAPRAQFRPLDDRRRDGVAIRAAHPRGRRMAAGKAPASRQPRRNDQPDRPGNRRGRALEDGAGRIGPCLWQKRGARGPQDGTCDARLAGKIVMSLTLYFHPLSSFCQKTLIALYENGTPFTPQIVNLMDPKESADFKEMWPVRKFPVLRDGDRMIPESSIIIEYLAQHYPGKSELLPRNPDLALRT